MSVVGRLGWDLEEVLSSRVRSHQAENIFCSSCHAPGKHSCLPKFAMEGQKPEYMIWSDGNEQDHPVEVFGITPPRAFFSTGTVIPSHRIWDPNHANSHFAAATYGRYLNVENCVVFSSSDNPTAQNLVNHFNAHQTSPFDSKSFIAPCLNMAKDVFTEVKEVARQLNKSDDIRTLYKLASMALVRFNAENIGDVFGKEHVVTSFLDVEEGKLKFLDPKTSLIDLFLGHNQDHAISMSVKRERQIPKALCCSCCDSRAGGRHLFGTEVASSNTIAAIVPPHSSLVNGHAHSTWAEIEHAMRVGINDFIILGHSKCGGVDALINMRLNKGDPGQYINPWLMQAASVVDEALRYAETHKLSRPHITELVEKQIIKWSARNIVSYVGPHARVYPYYLEIDTRNVQKVNIYESLQDTCLKIRTRDTLEYLYYAQTPPNVFNPPAECPPLAHGGERKAPAAFGNLEWLLRLKTSQKRLVVA